MSGIETYMSVTVVTGATIGTTTDDAIVSVTPTTSSFVSSISVTSAICEACGEEPLVTSVSAATATAVTGVSTTDDAFVTGVTLTETTEEILIPIVMTDTAGRAHIVLSAKNPPEPEDYTTD